MTRRHRSLLALLAAGALAGIAAAPAGAQDPIDQRPVAIPPAYPAPSPGTITLPAPPRALVPRVPGVPERPVWASGQTDVRVGIGPDGRIIHHLQETPSRFRP